MDSAADRGAPRPDLERAPAACLLDVRSQRRRRTEQRTPGYAVQSSWTIYAGCADFRHGPLQTRCMLDHQTTGSSAA